MSVSASECKTRRQKISVERAYAWKLKTMKKEQISKRKTPELVSLGFGAGHAQHTYWQSRAALALISVESHKMRLNRSDLAT